MRLRWGSHLILVIIEKMKTIEKAILRMNLKLVQISSNRSPHIIISFETAVVFSVH